MTSHRKSRKRIFKPHDVHTNTGFQTLCTLPNTDVEHFFGSEMRKALDHLWDAMWISRVIILRQKCEVIPCPKKQINLPPWGEMDICSFSMAVDTALKVFIQNLTERFAELDPPPLYPDLITLFQRIQADLQEFTQYIDPDFELGQR